jgi:hypothetical protein
MRLFEWWAGLPTVFKLGVAGLFLLVSTVMWFASDTFWPYGWIAGVVLLLLSFPSGPKGYHDF